MKKFTFLLLGLLLPAVSHAQDAGLKDLLLGVGDLIDMLIPIAFSLAVLYFIWGLAKFILNAGSEEAQTEGKNIMKWGIVALFVMVAIWGIVAFIGNELDLVVPGNSNIR